MLKKIWDVLKKRNMLEKSLLDTIKMLEMSKKQFEDAFKSLVEFNTEIAQKVVERDKKIDDMKVKIRKEMLAYLVGSYETDITYSVLIIDASTNIERIGDYCASIAEMVIEYPKPLDRDDAYHPLLFEAYETICGLFDSTSKAVTKDSDTIATQTIEEHKTKTRTLTNKITEMLNNDTEVKTKRAIRLALLSHLFRRISGHLASISGSVISPMHK